MVRHTGGTLGVAIGNARVVAGVTGVGTTSHHAYASETQSWHIGVPRMGHTYKFVPRWHGDAVNVAPPHFSQCGRADATIRHGHSKWTLLPPNACLGSL
jgi:hypothetical protein